jgi:CubicO group peptidase (beta-lactamase class C family)
MLKLLSYAKIHTNMPHAPSPHALSSKRSIAQWPFRFSLQPLALVVLLLLQHPTAWAGDPVQEWLLLGPMPMEADAGNPIPEEEQLAFFEADQIDPTLHPEAGQGMPYGDARLIWNTVRTDDEGRVLLDELLGEHSFAAAYAYAVLSSDKARRINLGLGSDDAVRVWLNGELVHEHWGGRGLRVNTDILTLSLQEGENHLMLKVQNMEYGWGFALQRLQREDLDRQLALAAGHGDLDDVEQLLELGADPMVTRGPGLNAWQFARIRGRREVCTVLAKAGADTSLPMPPMEELAVWMLEQEIGSDGAGAAVLVARGGELLFDGAAGLADIESGRSLSPESLFRIGSITKPITATAILMLAEAGGLSLDQTIDRWYPNMPNAERITVEHLLTHTSGLASYTDQPEFQEHVESYISPADLEARIAALEPVFEPGSSWAYCNSGYFLLGRIVKKVSGSSLEAFLQEYLFTPHDMVRSSIYDNREEILRRDEALGYAWNGKAYERAMDWDMSWAGGAGAIQSTVGDLHRFAHAWFGGKLIGETLMEAATQPVEIGGVPAAAIGNGYGYGWALGSFRGEPYIWHSGGLHGFVSQLAYFPRLDLYGVALMNALPSHGPEPQSLVSSLIEIAAWQDLAPQESFRSLTDADLPLEDYVGRYGYPGGAVMTVRTENGRLYAQLTGQQEFELHPRGEDEFFWKVVEASILFVRDAEGRVSGGLHRQGGTEMEVGKLKDQASVALREADLDRVTGIYVLRGMDLTVERRGSRLWVLLPGQPEVEIFPKSPSEFFLKVVQARIEFALPGDGPATGLTLFQGGLEMEAPRKAP